MSCEPSAKRTSTHSSGVSVLCWGHFTTRKVGRPTSPLLTGPVEKSHASLLSEKGKYFPVVSHTYLKRPAARCERGPGQTSTSSSSERVGQVGWCSLLGDTAPFIPILISEMKAQNRCLWISHLSFETGVRSCNHNQNHASDYIRTWQFQRNVVI